MDKTKLMLRLNKVWKASLIGLVAGIITMGVREISKYNFGIYTLTSIWVLLCVLIQTARQLLLKWKNDGGFKPRIFKISKGTIIAIISALIVILNQIKGVIPLSPEMTGVFLAVINILIAVVKNGALLWKESGNETIPVPEEEPTTTNGTTMQ